MRNILPEGKDLSGVNETAERFSGKPARGKSNLPGPLACSLVLLVASSLSFTCPFLTRMAFAQVFSDLDGCPPEVREAVVYVTEKGYMKGGSDGRFHPNAKATRSALAYSLVKFFRLPDAPNEKAKPFKDIGPGDKGFRYARIAVDKGLIDCLPDGSFAPEKPVKTWEVFKGFAKGFAFELECLHIRGLFPLAHDSIPFLVIGHNLGLKRRNSRILPAGEYTRGELAFTLKSADCAGEWKKKYLRESFDWMNCQAPLLGEVRKKALGTAFSRIGFPYVWGGESDEEGGYDCSGFVYFVLYKTLGYPMMRVADDQARDARYATVGRKELLAGDPVFFYGSGSEGGYVNHAGLYLGHGLFIHSTGSNSGVSIDRLTGYWDEKFAWGKRVIPEGEPESFDTYLLLSNPTERPARSRLDFMLSNGLNFDQEVELPPFSRKTVRVDDIFYNQEVSTVVSSSVTPIAAERSMYFRYGRKFGGGHIGGAVNEPSTEWLFAEGCTDYGFDTFFLLLNPCDERALVKCSYYVHQKGVLEHLVEIQPKSRLTVSADSIPGLEKAEFSLRVVSSVPVVAERSMYFDYSGFRDGHNSTGVRCPEKTWYFAEGFTGGKFDTYILVMNPNPYDVPVSMELVSSTADRSVISFGMRPRSRKTIRVDDIKGWDHREVSIIVRSPRAPVVAERSMYFEYNGIDGGHNVVGACMPSRRWYIAEGYTAQGFDTYVLLLNPGKRDATTRIRFLLSGEKNVERKIRIGKGTRHTIHLDLVKGIEAAEVSTSIESSEPLVAERSLYFTYGRIKGGSCAIGLHDLARKWYFAEGYTGL